MATTSFERLQRKIIPIYDSLDNGNYKGALKLCEKKDIKDFDITIVLKAHALERLGRSDEALSLCRQIKGKRPTDNGILTALTLTYKLMDLPDEATECYENALAANPSNSEMTQEVHFSYTRTFNYSKQQQYAMKLYKQISAPHFVFWSATAMLLQVRTSGEQSKMLVLSEKMARRAIDGRIEKGQKPSSQEINLLVALLKQQGKSDEALSLVISHKDDSNTTSPINDEDTLKDTGVPSEFLLMQPSERVQLEASLKLETKDFNGAVITYEELIEKDPDEWSHHMGYFDALFSSDRKDELIPEQESRIASLQSSSPKARAPYLVEMDFLSRIIKDPHPAFPDPCALIGDHILKYLDLFSHKLCCFTDLESYMLVIASSESVRTKVVENIKQYMELNFPAEALERAERTEKLHRYICCRQCLRYLEKNTRNVENLLSDAKSLFELFVNTLDVNEGAKGGQREVQHGDELVLLSVHMLRDASVMNPAISYQCHVDAALILQFGRSQSPYNFHMNLCLMEECRQLGCFELGIELFNDLKIRHVQMDSLSYLLSPGCSEGGFFSEVERQCRGVIRFHRSAARDAGDYAVKAYESGNYMQVLELCEFQSNSLARSIQLASSRADLVLLQLVLVKHSTEDAITYLDELHKTNDFPRHDLAFDQLVFNHDFSVGLDWSGENAAKTSAMKATFLRQLKLHTCLPRLLRASLSPEVDEHLESDLESFSSYSQDSNCALVGGDMVQMVSQCDSLSWRLCYLIFKVGLKMKSKDGTGDVVNLWQEIKSLLAELFSLFQCNPYITVSAGDTVKVLAPWWLASCSAFISSALPILSLMLQYLTIPESKNKKNKNKKAAGAVDIKAAMVEAAAAREALVDLLQHLCSVLKTEEPCPSTFATMNSQSLLSLLSIPDSGVLTSSTDAVFLTMTSSRKLSVSRLLDVLNMKVAVLSSAEVP